MIIYTSDYKAITFQAEDSLLITRWKPSTESLDDDKLKEEIKRSLELIKKHRPQSILINTIDFNYIIVPEIQEWFDNEVFTVYPEAGVQKKAFLVSKDLFAQVSLTQHVDDIEHRTFESAFFDNEAKAIEWLQAS
ncbi:hypothetical protein BKI52_00180 [marine bacterium AO1-C]|nr:hypothetical protein BKI52_00180 [marine bacterium AO1-C]